MIEFEIAGAPPLLLNARIHWRELRRQKAQWYSWVHIALGRQAPAEPFDRACVRFTRHCGTRRPDRDNLISGSKWIQDALVNEGVLLDDQEENLEAHHEWHAATKKAKRIHVQVVPIYSIPVNLSVK